MKPAPSDARLGGFFESAQARAKARLDLVARQPVLFPSAGAVAPGPLPGAGA